MSDESRNERRHRGAGPTAPPDLGEAMVTPSQDTVFRLLANEQRREVCHYLATASADVHELSEIVEAVAPAIDCDPERLAIGLHHQHLPKFDRAGLLDYDPRSRTVRYRGQPCIEKWATEARLLAEQESTSGD
jgi:hypothetical protein